MRHPVLFGIVVACCFGAVCLTLSFVIAPPPGADHHCPSGASPSDCRYPPHYAAWEIDWTIVYLIIGTYVALAIHRRRRRRVNLPPSVINSPGARL